MGAVAAGSGERHAPESVAPAGTNHGANTGGWGTTPLAWLPLGAALGAVVSAVLAWEGAEDRDRATVLLFLAVVPFVVVLALPRIPLVVLSVSAVPIWLYAFDGGVPIAAAMPAMAIVIAAPALSRAAGIALATVIGAGFLVAGVATGEVEWIATAAGMGAAWVGGWSIGSLVRRDHEHEQGVSAAEATVRAERRHLAREVHDLVAHALTGTMLSLAEVRLLLDRDREAVLLALDRAEELARESLGDLRRTVRLLSEEGDPSLQPPIELEDDLNQLIDGYRRSGVTVTQTVTGEPVPLSVASSWGVFRIVQESLTNAVRHAPGADIEVAMTWTRDGLRVVVTSGLGTPDPAQKPGKDGAGRGVPGMAERAVLLGGRLEAGPTSTGWMVSGFIPVAPVLGVEL